MRAIICCLALLFCMYGIPTERWEMMGEKQQDEIVDDAIQDMILDLGCDEVEAEVIVKGKWIYILGQCVEDKYIASQKKDGTVKWL